MPHTFICLWCNHCKRGHFQESWFWANKLITRKWKVSPTTTFKILTANITKNQNLKKTFKDPYLFDKDGGGFGQTLRYFSKVSRGIQLCATFSGTQLQFCYICHSCYFLQYLQVSVWQSFLVNLFFCSLKLRKKMAIKSLQQSSILEEL